MQLHVALLVAFSSYHCQQDSARANLPDRRVIVCPVYVQSLPGADRQMKVISGDVTQPDSLTVAMRGCDQLVHLAAVVDLLTPKDEQERHKMVQTAVQGTQMVLGEPSWLSCTVHRIWLPPTACEQQQPHA